MASKTLTKLLSRLQHGGLRSSCAVRRVNTTGTLLPSGMLPQAEDFHTLPPSVASNHSLQSGNQCGAARCKLVCSCAAEGSGCRIGSSVDSLTLNQDYVWNNVIREVDEQIEGSLVCLAVHRGSETLALLPGTIIRSDGIVATSASRLCCLKSKELKDRITVKVLDTKATYKGVLLDADICSNLAFIKILSPGQQEVARFGKLDYEDPKYMVVAVSSTAEWHHGLAYAKPHYRSTMIRSIVNATEDVQSDARTPGLVINAKCDEIGGSVIGGPLVDPLSGVVGVIHYESNRRIKATRIDDVLNSLERSEKHREQHPTSVASA